MSWQMYLQYDEDSLTSLSNVGLLRRAKKSVDQVQLTNNPSELSTEHDVLQFRVEEFQVELPATGITNARCACPASDCCKHILSSILWLQQHPEQLQQTSTDVVSAPPHENTDVADQSKSPPTHPTQNSTALDSLLSLDSTAILKATRKAERRLAYQIVQQWQADPTQCEIEIQQDKISFKTNFSMSKIHYFAGATPETMLSDIASAQKIAVHLACIAWCFLTQQDASQPSSEKNSSENSSANRSQNHSKNTFAQSWQWSDDVMVVAQQTQTQELDEDDLALIRALEKQCQAILAQGLSHLSKTSIMALHLLNMQARAQRMPRLASLLRHLHGQLERLHAEDIQIDERQVFVELAQFYTFLAALKSPQLATEKRLQLTGNAQKSYQIQTFSHLIPLGADWWHAPTGAQGLTTCFWDTAQQRLVSTTQARANHLDQTFDQHSAAQMGMWGVSLNHLMQYQFSLDHAKASTFVTDDASQSLQHSNNLNISPNKDANYHQLAPFDTLSVAQFQQQVAGISDWSTLAEQIRPRSIFDQNQPHYALLHITRITSLQLNELQQQLETWLSDQHGHQLLLQLEINPSNHSIADKLQYHIDHSKIIAVLVRIQRQAGQLRCTPCTLILQDRQRLHLFNLHYDYIRHSGKRTIPQSMSARIEKLLKEKKRMLNVPPKTPLQQCLAQCLSILEFYANSGRQQFDSAHQQQLAGLGQRFEDLGLNLLTDVLARYDTIQQQSQRHKQSQTYMPDYLMKIRQVIHGIELLQNDLPMRTQPNPDDM